MCYSISTSVSWIFFLTQGFFSSLSQGKKSSEMDEENKTIHRVENLNVVPHEDMVQENSRCKFEFFFKIYKQGL